MNPASTRHESKRESSRSPSRATSQSELPRRVALSPSESLAAVISVKPRKGPPLSAVPSSKSIASAQSVRRKPSASRLPPKKPTESKKPPPARKVAKKIKIKASVTKRAKGRDKVPEKFRDSFKNFFFSPSGMLKVLRMCHIAASLLCFIAGGGHELFIAITIQETCIVVFFIIIYLVTLHHLMICMHWPLLSFFPDKTNYSVPKLYTIKDLINSLISSVFLGIVAMATIQEKERPLIGTGGVLCLSAAILCLIDALLVTKKMWESRRKAQGV